MNDADKQKHERLKAHMRDDYLPSYPMGVPISPEIRMASAAEYSAHQLGQINRSLARIADVLEKKVS